MSKTSYIELLKITQESLNCLPSSRTFNVKDLFEGAYWKSLSKGDRLGLGRYFKQDVESNNINSVMFVGKVSNNLVIYKKI